MQKTIILYEDYVKVSSAKPQEGDQVTISRKGITYVGTVKEYYDYLGEIMTPEGGTMYLEGASDVTIVREVPDIEPGKFYVVSNDETKKNMFASMNANHLLGADGSTNYALNLEKYDSIDEAMLVPVEALTELRAEFEDFVNSKCTAPDFKVSLAAFFNRVGL